jgi:hypothetical protein
LSTGHIGSNAARGWRLAAVLAIGVVSISGCSGADPTSAVPVGPPPATSAARTPAQAGGSTDAAGTPAPSTPAAASSSATRSGSRLKAADRRAGLRSDQVAWSGSGRLRVVPGDAAAPGKGRVYRIRVEVESGLDVDRAAFAKYVLATLNDERSWTENGRRRFARTDGAADIRVVLASPETSAAICRPLRTFGKLSCRHGNEAVLTMYRWVKAIPEYARDRDGYRHYVINHEVGHALGHAHEYCAGSGRRAPVMMQQTKGLQGCRPNPWPHP